MYYMRTSLAQGKVQVFIEDPAAPSRSSSPSSDDALHYRYTVNDVDASFETLLNKTLVNPSSSNAPTAGWTGVFSPALMSLLLLTRHLASPAFQSARGGVSLHLQRFRNQGRSSGTERRFFG